MKDLDAVMKELARSGKREELEKLASSGEGRALENALDGAALEKAVRGGDAAALRQMLGALMATPEGRRLAEDVGRIMRE